MKNLTITAATEMARRGSKVAREGWNGKGMFLVYVPGGTMVLPGTKELVQMLPFMVMRTVTGAYVPWLASQTDLLASDWMTVDGT